LLHLIHPALVHFTVAFLVTGAVCEALGILARREAVERFGGLLVLLGTLSLPPTLVSGILAGNTVTLTPEARQALDAHERMGYLLLGVFLAALFWKAWERGRVTAARPAYALLLLAGAALAAYVAFLGGSLVYAHGVGVGLR
jgi:uncharacterized membrane protein